MQQQNPPDLAGKEDMKKRKISLVTILFFLLVIAYFSGQSGMLF